MAGVASTSNAASGSSSSSRPGSGASALASATRCCCPPDSWAGRRSASSAASTAASSSRARCSAATPGRPVRPRAEGHVAQRGQVREQQGLLGQQADPAPVRRHVHPVPGDRVVADPDVPAVRAKQPGQHAEQRRFAGPVGTQHGQHLAGLGGQRHIQGEGAPPDQHLGVQAGPHPSSSVRGRATAITTTATTTSNSDSATAASTSDSRSR